MLAQFHMSEYSSLLKKARVKDQAAGKKICWFKVDFQPEERAITTQSSVDDSEYTEDSDSTTSFSSELNDDLYREILNEMFYENQLKQQQAFSEDFLCNDIKQDTDLLSVSSMLMKASLCDSPNIESTPICTFEDANNFCKGNNTTTSGQKSCFLPKGPFAITNNNNNNETNNSNYNDSDDDDWGNDGSNNNYSNESNNNHDSYGNTKPSFGNERNTKISSYNEYTFDYQFTAGERFGEMGFTEWRLAQMNTIKSSPLEKDQNMTDLNLLEKVWGQGMKQRPGMKQIPEGQGRRSWPETGRYEDEVMTIKRLPDLKEMTARTDGKVREFEVPQNLAESKMHHLLGENNICSQSSIQELDSRKVDGRTGQKSYRNAGRQLQMKKLRGRSISMTSSTSSKSDMGPRKQTPKSAQSKKLPKLLRFLKQNLESDNSCQCLKWLDKESKTFRIVGTRDLSQLWGATKRKPDMKYEHLARTLRGYVAKGLLKKPRKKLIYQFA